MNWKSRARNQFLFIPFLILVALYGAHTLHAQNASPRASTMGACSPIVLGSRNVIDCGALSAHDAGVLAEILNEAHASSKSLSEIKELIEKALDPNRTTVTFMPDGESMTKNETAGSTMVMDKGERDVFEQFIALESAKNWTALLSLVQSEENKVPTWFTVDYFSSEAYFHTCRLDKAVESLNKFIAEVRHVGNYAEMFKHSQEILLDLESRGEAMRRNCADHGAPTQQ